MTASTATDDILAKLQRAYDLVKRNDPREIRPEDHLVDDLDLDSLDLVDVVSVLEEDVDPDVIDAVIDDAGDIATVQELIDRVAAASS